LGEKVKRTGVTPALTKSKISIQIAKKRNSFNDNLCGVRFATGGCAPSVLTQWRATLPPDEWQENLERMRAGVERWR